MGVMTRRLHSKTGEGGMTRYSALLLRLESVSIPKLEPRNAIHKINGDVAYKVS